MLLKELLKAIQPVEVAGDSDIEITGVNIDSRQWKPANCSWQCAARKPTATPTYLLP